MTERFIEDPWTDEVCQYWLDQALIETRSMGLTNAELNIYFEAHAPTAVLNYLLKTTLDGISGVGIALKPKSVEVDINDYLNNQN